MLPEFIILIGGLIGLWLGADIIVGSGKAIAHRLGLSELMIGLTIVSIGTSLPEIMVSVFSGAKSAPDVAVGAMVGSCLAQTTLILGLAGIVHKIQANKKALRIDGMMMLLAVVIFWIVVATGEGITRIEAAIMIAIYLGYLIFTVKHSRLSQQAEERGEHDPQGYPLGLRLLFLVAGLGLLVVSANIVLDQSVLIASYYGFSEAFIGLMVVGTATCLPELSTAIVSALKKSSGIGIGTLIGSNITDPLLSTASGALVYGFAIEGNGLVSFDIPFWFVASIIALLLLHRKRLTLNRGEASILVAIYAIFVLLKITIF